MCKLYFLLALFITFIFVPSTFAWVEEDACFKLLNQAVKNDARFKDKSILKNGDLSKVLYNEGNSADYDFSSYDNFYQERSYKTAYEPSSQTWSEYLFSARRNNIGTIISPSNYIYSQIAWFWKDSNFDFPLSVKSWIPLWDAYKLNGNFFKEYVLYTHHLNNNPYDLLSCGIVKVIPLSKKTFSEISEGWYMTNILTGKTNQSVLGGNICNSGFEWEYVSDSGQNFYKMKSDVCVIDYAEKDYLKIEVISLAYDNGSTRLNEYYTHPLQVMAMKNNLNHTAWLKGIQEVFFDLLKTKTCFSVVHGAKQFLPASCNGKYGPVAFVWNQKNLFSLFFDFLFPATFARLDIGSEFSQKEEDTGMLAFESISYRLYEKLKLIPDAAFREYLTLAIIPNFEELIQHRKENNVLLSPFEETFLACGIDYAERVKIVEDFLEKLDLSTFSLMNLTYLNPKFGDCIVPYPDKQNIGKVIEGSFDSNKIFAENISGINVWWDISPQAQQYFQEREALLEVYNTQLQNIEKRFSAGEIDFDTMKSEKESIETQYATNIKVLEQKITELWESKISNTLSDTVGERYENKRFLLIIIVLLILSGMWVILYVIFSSKKGKV